jgi:hypothetical protein
MLVELQVKNFKAWQETGSIRLEADSPSASGPRSAASASLKSPVEMPFK